ncbi:hypothetical protein RF11_05753 [Thelohanellus kitauei]|uniref:Uncharacterized protein n=1 Tax=Thelohanellus kitauei TaxID=669202 RepID=A0A0C2M7A3_THEKT|nr:hypothetical protein RF11_05753 [Thelohanellus kitauei]
MKYTESGVIEDDKRGGLRSTKVQDIHLERIERAIEENPTTTLKEIKILHFEEFQLSITETTVSRAISKLGITYKLIRILLTYSKLIVRPLHMSDDTIYMDERGFNLHLTRIFGRAPSRKRSEMFEKTWPGSKIVVIYNFRFHHTEDVKRFVEDRGH